MNLDALRSAVSIVTIVAAYIGLTKVGRDYLGLCPLHSEKTPSFSVNDDRGLFYCLGCGAGGDAVTFLMRMHDCEFLTAVRHLADLAGAEPGTLRRLDRVVMNRAATDRRCKQTDSEGGVSARIASARRLWRGTRPAPGTLVERYLRSRGITVEIPATIRFIPTAWHAEAKVRLPVIIGVVQDTAGHIIGVHRTFLAQDGLGKAPVSPAKKMLGPCGGGAVRLAKAGSMLAITEGIETGLSVLQATEIPAWAALSASGIVALILPPLPVASAVSIFADHDPAGIAAAERAAVRWSDEGRSVRIALPPKPHTDFNDILRGEP